MKKNLQKKTLQVDHRQIISETQIDSGIVIVIFKKEAILAYIKLYTAETEEQLKQKV